MEKRLLVAISMMACGVPVQQVHAQPCGDSDYVRYTTTPEVNRMSKCGGTSSKQISKSCDVVVMSGMQSPCECEHGFPESSASMGEQSCDGRGIPADLKFTLLIGFKERPSAQACDDGALAQAVFTSKTWKYQGEFGEDSAITNYWGIADTSGDRDLLTSFLFFDCYGVCPQTENTWVISKELPGSRQMGAEYCRQVTYTSMYPGSNSVPQPYNYITFGGRPPSYGWTQSTANGIGVPFPYSGDWVVQGCGTMIAVVDPVCDEIVDYTYVREISVRSQGGFDICGGADVDFANSYIGTWVDREICSARLGCTCTKETKRNSLLLVGMLTKEEYCTTTTATYTTTTATTTTSSTTVTTAASTTATTNTTMTTITTTTTTKTSTAAAVTDSAGAAASTETAMVPPTSATTTVSGATTASNGARSNGARNSSLSNGQGGEEDGPASSSVAVIAALSVVGLLLFAAATFIGVKLSANKDHNNGSVGRDDGAISAAGATIEEYNNPAFRNKQQPQPHQHRRQQQHGAHQAARNPAGTIKFSARNDALPLPRSPSGRRPAVLTEQANVKFLIPMEESPSVGGGAVDNNSLNLYYLTPVTLNANYGDNGDYAQPVADYEPAPGAGRGDGGSGSGRGDGLYVADGFYDENSINTGTEKGGSNVEYAVPTERVTENGDGNTYVADTFYADGNRDGVVVATHC